MSDAPLKDFGFQKIDPAEKTRRVQALFDQVASSYDVMNDVMSFGLHRVWKADFVANLPLPSKGATEFAVLDLAGGTGDITQRMLAKYEKTGIPTEITLADLSEGMIQEGRKRKTLDNVHWVCGNGENLPFADHHFDVCTLVFGLRNMTYVDKVLTEILRVLKPGGSFHCLEFSAVNNPLLSGLYDLYSFQAIPRFGRWIAGDEPAYRYLVESIRRFPSQNLLADLMRETGFVEVTFDNYMGGIAAVHRGVKHASL